MGLYAVHCGYETVQGQGKILAACAATFLLSNPGQPLRSHRDSNLSRLRDRVRRSVRLGDTRWGPSAEEQHGVRLQSDPANLHRWFPDRNIRLRIRAID